MSVPFGKTRMELGLKLSWINHLHSLVLAESM